jgi:hypothetical protein
MPTCPEFTIEGVLDGRPTVARWLDGQLDAEPELLRRAHVVVALGEEFSCEDGPHGLRASIDDGGVALLLTLMRALTEVTSVDMELTVPRRSERRRFLLRPETT